MRGLTGERPENEGRRGDGEETRTGRREDGEGRRQVTAEGRDDLRDDMLQTLLMESVGVAVAIGIAAITVWCSSLKPRA